MRLPLLLLISAAVLVPGCPKSSSNSASSAAILSPAAEAEPNDSVLTATALSASGAGSGTIAAADLDFWSFSGTAGAVVQIEIYGTRLDQAGWLAAAAIPVMRLFAPDGVTELVRTDSALWGWGSHDLDLFAFKLTATGTHSIRVAASTGGAGGKYAIAVRSLSYPAFQAEVEPNDTFGTATPVVPGSLYGHHTDNESDFYSFAIAAPTIITFEMQAYRNGVFTGDDDYFDTIIEVLDTDGATVLFTDDDMYFYDSSVRAMLVTPGTYFLRVFEFGGTPDADYVLNFTTAAVGTTAEVEPNDATGTATGVAYGTIITANHAADDDVFSFAGQAGDMVRIIAYDADTIQGASADLTYALLAPDGVTVVASDYDDGPLQVVRMILPQTGSYFLRVTGPAATTYALEFTLLAATSFEAETNNSQFTAGSFNTAGFASGVANTDADLDFVKFDAQAGELVTILAYADQPGTGADSDGFFAFSGWGSTLQPRLRVMNGAGSFVAEARTSLVVGNPTTESIINGLACAQVSFIAPAAGTYYLVVSAENTPVSSSHVYALQKK